MSTATRNGNALIVRNAALGSHMGQSTGWAATRLWGRRALDIGMTGLAGAVMTSGGVYIYDALRGDPHEDRS